MPSSDLGVAKKNIHNRAAANDIFPQDRPEITFGCLFIGIIAISLVPNHKSFDMLDYAIETLFSDKKSRGFHIDKSHLSEPTRLARLLIATSLAYIWMIYLGLSVIQAGCTDLIDRVDRVDKSLFRLGLGWLHYLLKWEKPFAHHSRNRLVKTGIPW